MQRPRLKDSKHRKDYELYPLGQIPNNVIYTISKWMTYYFSIGKGDISGEDWGDIFAKAVDGVHLDKPLGLADVVYEGMAWSVKSVKSSHPLTQKSVRLISGRNSPDYSFGIENPHNDIQKTGSMVLSIWNERVKIAREKYYPLRTCVLIRNFNTLSFTLFENEIIEFDIENYKWEENNNGNLVGFNISNGIHCFTWQPHGSQFTIICDVPNSAKKFTIRRPPIIELNNIMDSIGFNDNWVTFI